MNADNVLVSILIPCFNAAPYVETSLRSALAARQELGHGRCEILVLDDGSSDDSASVVASFASQQVSLLGDGVNRGGNHARETLRQQARGTFHQYLDADDALLPGKLTRQLEVAMRESADLIYSPPLCVTDDDPRWEQVDLRADTVGTDDARDQALPQQALDAGVSSDHSFSGPTQATASRDVWVDFIRWGQFQTSSMLFRAAAIEAVGGWKMDQPRCQEHELLLRMLIAGQRLVRSEDSRTLYRVVEGKSVSRRHADATIALRMQLTERAEKYLTDRKLLTAERRAAIAAARMESARSLYRYDRVEASRLADRVGRVNLWRASSSDALPRSYRLMATIFGFSFAEWIAGRRRNQSPVS